MIILKLLGSSDDKEKEKIGVARPKGPPIRGFRKDGPHHQLMKVEKKFKKNKQKKGEEAQA